MQCLKSWVEIGLNKLKFYLPKVFEILFIEIICLIKNKFFGHLDVYKNI